MKQTEIRIRAMEPEDLDELYAIENDTSIWKVGQTNVPYSRYALHDYIAHSSADIYVDRQVRMMITSGGQTVGIVDVVNFDPSHRRAELGIVIKEAFRGQGYATATIASICEHARRIWHMHQLYVVVDEGNKTSVNLFRQHGFTVESRLRDWLFDGTEYHDALLMQTFL